MNLIQETKHKTGEPKESQGGDIRYEVKLSDDELDMERAVSDIVDLFEFLIEHEESPESMPEHVENRRSFHDGLPGESLPSSSDESQR